MTLKSIVPKKGITSKVKLGQIFSLKINALGPKKMGLVELNNGLTVFVPNANLGDLVKVKLEKILPYPYGVKKKTKKIVILGTLVQVIQKGKFQNPPEGGRAGSFEVGQKLRVSVKRKGPKNSGLAFPLSSRPHRGTGNPYPVVPPVSGGVGGEGSTGAGGTDFPIMIPNMKVDSVGDVEVKITKLKSNYAFGSLTIPIVKNQDSTRAFLSKIERSDKKNLLSLVLPVNSLNLPHFFAFKLNGNFLFVQKSLGIKGGDHILIKLLRIRENFSIGKVVKVFETGENKKRQNQKMKSIFKKMILSSMHYGERAVRCNANMRPYLWLRKKGKNQNKPLLKRGRHILNLFQTYKSFKKSLFQLSKYAANGQTFLFVGTKKSASSLIARTAVLSQTSFFVNSRWLGGMLTNWKTILKSLSQMKPILKEKQKVIQNLLFSRQRIKDRLLAKVNLLRKKSRKFMFKGKKLLLELQQNPKYFIEKNQFILNQKNMVFVQNKDYIEKYSIISIKEQKLLFLLNSFKSFKLALLKQRNSLKNQILNTKKEIYELKQLFLIAQKVAAFKNSMLTSDKTLWSVSYNAHTTLPDNVKSVPNPSIDIFNQMILVYLQKSQLIFHSNEAKSIEPVVLSKLLDKFSVYLPFMKKYLLLIYNRLYSLEKNFKQLNQNISNFSESFQANISKALTYKNTLEILKSKLLVQKKYLKVLKFKLRIMSSEQRLLKFLPKLRYLPTTKTKMYQRVELLMKKFVDPKMSYVIDEIYDQKFQSTSKKMAAARKQKWQRLEKYFGGVTQMAKMSTKQIYSIVAIIIGQQEEMNAVRECQKLGIKMFTVVDTNCNPNLSDYIIPANDDSSTSMEYILGQMLTYIRLAQKLKRKISI